jgi:hypothetical protein
VVRLLALAGATLLPDWFGFAAPPGVRAALVAAALVSALWLVRGPARVVQAA